MFAGGELLSFGFHHSLSCGGPSDLSFNVANLLVDLFKLASYE